MRTGVIGYGSMGSMLILAFLKKSILKPEEIVIATRTPERCHTLLRDYPGITLAENTRDLARLADRIIISVKPGDVVPVLEECADLLGPRHHLISAAACVPLREMARIYPGRITRILPSLVNAAGAGCILCCHNPLVTEAEACHIESLFGCTGAVLRIREDQFEAAGDLMSCAPALFAAMADEFARAGLRHSDLTEEQAYTMVFSTFFGTGLLLDQGMTAQEIHRRVATPGGITEEGALVLRRELPPVFDHLFEATLRKHETVRKRLCRNE